MENSRNKKFLSFNVHAVLSSMMESCTFPLCPTQDVNHPFVQCVHIHYPTISHLVGMVVRLSRYCRACVQGTLILLNSGPNCKSSDAGNLDILLL